ncbi:MAG: hypothetical protein WCH84_05050 [Verrucomicrobiota bacterium]|jgi:hypothetical protein
MNRLPLNRCREILGNDCGMTDAELELLRDELYALADTAISEFVHQHRRTKVVTARRSEVAAAGNKDEIGHVKRSQPTEIESDCEDWIIIGYVDLKAFAN